MRAGKNVNIPGVALALALGCGSVEAASQSRSEPGTDPKRTQPLDLEPLGLKYHLRKLTDPLPNRVHILRVDLANEAIRPAVVIAADPDGDGPAEAALTDPRKLASDPSVVAFMNTNPWDGLPGADGKPDRSWFQGQPVDIHGIAVSGGKARGPLKPDAASVWVDAAGRVLLGNNAKDRPVEAMTGFQPIVKEGALVVPRGGARHPRSAIGVDRTGKILWLVVVDGRQKRFSEGMNLHELGSVLLDLGCWNATNMDGGGSSVLGLAGADGRLRIVNSPSDRSAGKARVRPLPMVLTITKRSKAGPSAAGEGESPSQPSTRGDERLTHEAVVNGSRAEVWAAWTTPKELEAWMVAHAEVDLRSGGTMRTHYDPQGRLGDPRTIENTIICYDPGRMLSYKVSKTPLGFPFPDAIKRMWTVVYLEAESPTRTRVRTVGLGFGDDQESRQMRAFFERGNAYTLQQLQRHLDKKNASDAK